MAENGTFYWNELVTTDVDAAKDFYADAVGWQYDAMDMGEGGTYWMVMIDGKPAAGLMTIPADMPADTPPYWRSYLAVDDVDAAVDRARSGGAEILMGPFDIPGVGRIAALRDPQGAGISIMNPAPKD